VNELLSGSSKLASSLRYLLIKCFEEVG
jgi:hypothetical protein